MELGSEDLRHTDRDDPAEHRTTIEGFILHVQPVAPSDSDFPLRLQLPTKRRNLQAHLPHSRYAYVHQTMNEAYRSESVDVARKRVQALASWLERSGYEEAAFSLREGMEQTLTVVKLGLPPSLQRLLGTTNLIENLIGSVRKVSRNVKRWRNPSMIGRWTALGVVPAEKKFRRIKGYRYMNILLHALRGKPNVLDTATNVA